MNFTDKYISFLKPKRTKYNVREARGFTVVVNPSGVKAFVYIYKVKGKQKYVPLGTYPAISLAEAREQYNIAYSQVQKGIDPKNPQPAGEESLTIETLLDKYFREWSAANHSDSWRYKLKKAVEKDVLPYWADKKITEIRRRDAINLLERIAERARGSATNILNVMRSAYTFAIDREYTETNPFLKMGKAVPSTRLRSRERALTEKEINFIWKEIDKGCGNEATKRALKFILVTAQRPVEVAGMHRDEIAGEWWTIPWQRIKTETRKNMNRQPRDHHVYLTPLALELIGDGENFIFSSNDGKSPITRNSISQIVSRKREGKGAREPYFGLVPWTPHDLRRTARTFWAKLGIRDEHAEAILNHSKKGIVRVYNRYRYRREIKEGLIQWSQKLRSIINRSYDFSRSI